MVCVKNNNSYKIIRRKCNGQIVKGMIWGSALGMTAAAAAITMMEPRVGRVIQRKSKQAARQMKRKFDNMM